MSPSVGRTEIGPQSSIGEQAAGRINSISTTTSYSGQPTGHSRDDLDRPENGSMMANSDQAEHEPKLRTAYARYSAAEYAAASPAPACEHNGANLPFEVLPVRLIGP